jgi:hypothetical protein
MVSDILKTMRKKPMAYQWFLPIEGDECPDTRWRLVYSNGKGATLPVEVCAPDEETARMRAGMKRAEMLRLDRLFWKGQFWKISKWTAVSLTQVS